MLTRVLGYAYDHHISVELHKEWSADWPSVSYPSHNLVVANLNSVRSKEQTFMVAHEIGHVLNGDEDGLLYMSNSREKSEQERDADRTAIRVLLRLCQQEDDYDATFFNSAQFMESLMIPASYEGYVKSLVE